ncbi:MAG: type II secretion system F family protein [Firmicutes bacterium]|nr:type II secretion system F family protein [Bacillota bacterium]
MTEYQIYILSEKERKTAVVVTALALAGVSMLFFQSPVLVLLLPAAVKPAWKLYGDYRRDRRQEALLKEFRDFLFSLSASFATGRHMTEAMKEAETALYHIYGDKGIMADELRYMLRAIEETGQSDQKLFADFAARSGLEDIQLLSEVYGACRETGGNMAAAVNKAAALLTEKINLEMEIQTMLSQKRLEGTIIAIMPAVMIIFLLWMSPEYLEPMYTTQGGRLMMAAALGINGFAYYWMEKMTNVTL